MGAALSSPKSAPLQVEVEVGDDLAQHPDVLLGEVKVVERLGERREHALASPRGAARAAAVWDLGPAAPRRDDVLLQSFLMSAGN